MKRTLIVLSGVVMAAVFNTAAVAQQNNDALNLLLDQFRALRGEMETLRSMVEEHGYDIRQLQQDSLDRYTDLDSRISTLYQELEAGAAARVTPVVTAPPVTVPSPSLTSATSSTSATGSTSSNPSATSQASVGLAVQQNPGGVSVQPGLLTEQQLYELALDSLLQQSAYQQSISQFDQYLAQYPNGRFVTNAYYWQGQAYVNLSMFNEARTAFETIINDYPDGRKIEDAMYSLGTVYHQLGDNTRARQMLQDVRSRFPNTSAANLADIYLRTLN